MLFLARLNDLDFAASTESLEVRLFGESRKSRGNRPDDFFALKKYFVDRQTGNFLPVMDKIVR